MFLFLFVGFVSGQSGCCYLNVDGIKCSNIDESECSVGSAFAGGSDCLVTSFCQAGCCYNENSGAYDVNVLKEDCGGGWRWSSDASCNLPGNAGGCCVLGESSDYLNLRECEVASLNYGVDNVDWRNIGEVECSFLVGEVKVGACVFGGSCSIWTEEKCYEVGGDFREGYLCTSESVDADCEMTEKTTCVSGKDGVYFVDSCGNVANVYDSTKVDDESYWDRMIMVEDSCDDGEGNADSKSCGNCNRFEGGFCANAFMDGFDVDFGNYYCKDTACEFDGHRYENGESWCVYDGATGNGLDVVGSRHWRYVCSQGNVQIEPCADYRNEVCVQSNTLGEGEDEIDFRSAVCRKNDWRSCISYNEEEDMEELCEDNEDCFVKSYSIGSLNKKVCVAKVPEGFSFEDDGEAEEICSLGSAGCVASFEKDHITLKWECVQGCECLTSTFTEAANNICYALGDCGAYVNFEGNTTSRGYKVSGEGVGLSGDYSSGLQEIGKIIRTDEYEAGALNNIFLLKLMDANNYTENHWNFMFNYLGVRLARTTIHDTSDDLLGIEMEKTKTAIFTCKPWVQPRGGDDCEVCNEDPLKPCSKYRCESLGGTCELINVGSENEYCYDNRPKDSAAPVISPLDGVALNSKYVGANKDGFKIEGEDSECLDAYTPLVFGIETDELADCKFDIEATDFENMSYDFGGPIYLYEHSTTFVLPDPAHGESRGSNWTGELTFYVKCQSVHGHENLKFYEVDMCVKAADDVTAPVIRSIVPENGGYVGFEDSSRSVSVITNELSTCRWDTSDVNYMLMRNDFVCDDTLSSPSSSIGYVCDGVLPVSSSENKFYISCMDQPWLEDSVCGGMGVSGCRNANTQSVYVLNKPDKKISIDSILPNSDFEIGGNVSGFDLKVSTSGGAGEHTCSYSIRDEWGMNEMLETGGKNHRQPLSPLPGLYNIKVECRDEAGDKALGSVSFEMIRDTSTTGVSRVWENNGELNIITTEDVECRYSEIDCGFDWTDGANAGSGVVHKFKVSKGKSYFVRCVDEFGNAPSQCTVSVKII